MSRPPEQGPNAALFTALAEPNRLRIVELLGLAPRPVGEIAARLGLRQPQATKHLQTLEKAGLVTVHRLGKRRIYALRHERLLELTNWLARFDTAHPSEDALQQYEAAIEAERVLAERDRSMEPRHLEFSRTFAAPAPRVWRAWTSAEEVARWWAPAHFRVIEASVTPKAEGSLKVVMEEGDGTRYASAGRFVAVEPMTRLAFTLAPLDPRGRPLFDAMHDVRLEEEGAATELSMTIRVTGATPQATTALAGMRMGWEQLFDKLAALVEHTH